MFNKCVAGRKLQARQPHLPSSALPRPLPLCLKASPGPKPMPIPSPDLTSSLQRPVGSQLGKGKRDRGCKRYEKGSRSEERRGGVGEPLCIRVLLCLMMPGIQHGRSLCSFIDGSFCCICCCCFPIGSRFLAGNSSPAIKIFSRIFRTKSLQQKNEMEQFAGSKKKTKQSSVAAFTFSRSLNTLSNFRSSLEIMYSMNIIKIYNINLINNIPFISF